MTYQRSDVHQSVLGVLINVSYADLAVVHVIHATTRRRRSIIDLKGGKRTLTLDDKLANCHQLPNEARS